MVTMMVALVGWDLEVAVRAEGMVGGAKVWAETLWEAKAEVALFEVQLLMAEAKGLHQGHEAEIWLV